MTHFDLQMASFFIIFPSRGNKPAHVLDEIQ